MTIQKASSSGSKEDAIVMGTPPIQRAHMPAWLFRAAVEGEKEVFESGMEETDGDAHLKVTIDVSGSSSNENAKKVAMAVEVLQSVTHMGNTLLHILATYGHAELASMVCQQDGSMWRVQNKMLETPFHCAAKAGQDKMLSKLVELVRNEEDQLKSVLREKNKYGETALHEAARRGYNSVVIELMNTDPLLPCEFNDTGTVRIYLPFFIHVRTERKTDKNLLS